MNWYSIHYHLDESLRIVRVRATGWADALARADREVDNSDWYEEITRVEVYRG